MTLEKLLAMDESPKLDFKAIWNHDDVNSELIKDIISLANGNPNRINEKAYLIFGISNDKQTIKSITDEELFLKNKYDDLPKLEKYILTQLKNFSTPDFLGLKLEFTESERGRVLLMTIPSHTYLLVLSKDLKLKNRTDKRNTVYYRINEEINIASPEIFKAFREQRKNLELKYKTKKNMNPILPFLFIVIILFFITYLTLNLKKTNDIILFDSVKIKEISDIKNESTGNKGNFRNIKYPEVYGMKDLDKQRRINYNIKKTALYFEEGERMSAFDSVDIAYEIIEANKQYLNIIFNETIHYKHAVTVHVSKKTVLIDVKTGNSIKLKNLFKKGYEAELLGLLNKTAEHLYEQDNSRPCNKATPYKITGDENFRIKTPNIEIYYYNGEVAARACGEITVLIPMSKIKHLVNTNGKLKYLIPSPI